MVICRSQNLTFFKGQILIEKERKLLAADRPKIAVFGNFSHKPASIKKIPPERKNVKFGQEGWQKNKEKMAKFAIKLIKTSLHC